MNVNGWLAIAGPIGHIDAMKTFEITIDLKRGVDCVIPAPKGMPPGKHRAWLTVDEKVVDEAPARKPAGKQAPQLTSGDFFENKTIEQIVAEQGTKPFRWEDVWGKW